MKYNININQLAIVDNNIDMDLIDASILDYLIDICSSVHERIEYNRITNESGKWTWLDYQSLIDGMPLLKITTKSGISNRIKKLKDIGFIKTFLDHSKNDGQKTYIMLTEMIDIIKFSENSRRSRTETTESEKNLINQGNKNSSFTQMNDVVHTDERRRSRTETYYNNIYNTNINNTNMIHNKNNIVHEEEKNPYNDSIGFNEFWSSYPRQQNKALALKSWKRIPVSLHEQIIADVKLRTKEHKQWQNRDYIPHASTYLNQRRWEDKIEKIGISGKNLQETEKYSKIEIHEEI
jgi:hypothetical protein